MPSRHLVADLIAEEARRFDAIDPLYPVNIVRHPSLGHPCRAGRSGVSMDGDDTVPRYRFIREPIANLHESGLESALVEQPYSNATCSCRIDYVHLDHLGLYPVFEGGVLYNASRPQQSGARASGFCFEHLMSFGILRARRREPVAVDCGLDSK